MYATSFDTGILPTLTRKSSGDTPSASTSIAIAAPVSDTWFDLVDPQSPSTPRPFLLRARDNVWAMLERAPMGVSRTTFGTSLESLATAQREEPGIPPNIQRALWKEWSAFADHTGYLSLGAFWTCFLVREQSSGLPRDITILPLLVNSTQSIADLPGVTWALDKADVALILKSLRIVAIRECNHDRMPCTICHARELIERLEHAIH